MNRSSTRSRTTEKELQNDQAARVLRAEVLRLLSKKLTISGGATVCCLQRGSSGHGPGSSVEMFTMLGIWFPDRVRSGLWMDLQFLLGVRMDGSSLADSNRIGFFFVKSLSMTSDLTSYKTKAQRSRMIKSSKRLPVVGSN